MGQAFERTIRLEGEGNKAVRSLEYDPETRMVRIRIDGKPGLPSVAFLPIEQISYIAPLPKEGEVKPAIAVPVPVYVPPPPPTPVVEVTAEQAAEIRRQYKINHPGPQPAQWEKDASAYAEQEQKRHMGLSVAQKKDNEVDTQGLEIISEGAGRDLRLDAKDYPKDRVLQQAVKELDAAKPKPTETTTEWVDPGDDPTMPKPKPKPKKKAKRKGKRKAK